MSGFERSEIIYEEGWRNSQPAPDSEPPVDEAPAREPEPEAASIPLLIGIQLAVFAIAAAVLLILKAIDSEAYHSFMTYYRVEMNKPLISQELFESLSTDRLMSTDSVTVQASPDELPHG